MAKKHTKSPRGNKKKSAQSKTDLFAKLFPYTSIPSPQKLAAIWRKCIFAFDANVLLSLYDYSPKTRKELIQLFSSIKKRLWIPNHSAWEFHKNRHKVVQSTIEAYSEIANAYKKSKQNLDNLLSILKSNDDHISLQTKTLKAHVRTFLKDFKGDLDAQEKKHPRAISKEEIKKEVIKIIKGRIGPAFTIAELTDIMREGKERYFFYVPPGFEDKKKKSFNAYGDLIIWKQMLSKATKSSKSIIFITNDGKPDWWLDFEGEPIAHPLLRQEFYESTKQEFYMYGLQAFVAELKKRKIKEVSTSAIDELEEKQLERKDKNIKFILDYLSLPSRPGPQLSELLDSLSFREKEIISLLYGLKDGFQYTAQEVAIIFKLTAEEVNQIQINALTKLRNLLAHGRGQ